jgi:hypothetical protein
MYRLRQHVLLVGILSILLGLGPDAFSQSPGYNVREYYNSGMGLYHDIVSDLVQDPDGNLLMINGSDIVLKFNGFNASRLFLKDTFKVSRLGFLNSKTPLILDNPFYKGFVLQNKEGFLSPFPLNRVPLMGSPNSTRVFVTDSFFKKKIIKTVVGENHARTLISSGEFLLFQNTFHIVDSSLAFLVYRNSLFIINAFSRTIVKKQLPSGNLKIALTGRFLTIITSKMEVLMYDEYGNHKDELFPFYKQVRHLLTEVNGKIAAYQDPDHDFLIIGNRLYVLENNRLPEATYKLILYVPQDVYVYGLLFSANKEILFIATLNKGLYIANRNSFFLYEFDKSVPGVTNIIYSHTRLMNGDILSRFGRITANDGKVITSYNKVLNYNLVYFRDRQGQLYQGVFDSIRIWDSSYAIKRSVIKPKANISDFCEGTDSNIYFSTAFSVGIIRNNKLKQEKYLSRYGEIIAIDYEGTYLWVVSDSGLLRFNASNLEENEQLVMFAGKRPRCVYADKRGTVWIGTSGDGIYKFTSDHKYIKLPVDKSKALLYTQAFYEDRNGFFWLATNNGIIQVLKSDLDRYKQGDWVYFYHYSEQHGLPVNEFNGSGDPANTESKSGYITLGSMSGVVEFNPLLTKPVLPVNPLRIDSIICNSKKYNSGDLTVSNKFERILIFINYPYFGKDDNCPVLYLLEGVTNQWTAFNPGVPLIINRLPTGHYTLRIRKVNGFGSGNWTETIVKIEVLPPWYLTVWAIAAWLLLLAVLIWIFINWRLQYLRRKEKMERLLHEHELKALRAQLNPHFLQNTFDLIAWRIREHDTEDSVRIIQLVSKYLRQVLQMSENPVISLEDELHFTKDYLKMLQVTLPEMLTFSINIQETVDSYGIQVPSLLLQPIIENSVKHGLVGYKFPGSVDINIYETGGFLQIEVKDSGIGLIESNKKEKKSESFGLELTKKRLMLVNKRVKEGDIKISIRARSDQKPGTEVVLEFPAIQA